MQKIKSAALALPALLLAGCAAALPAENTATIETAAAAAPPTLKVYSSASLAPAAQAYAEAQGVALTLTDEAASADLLLTDHAPGGSLLDVTSDTLLAAAAAHKNGKGADLVGINMEGPFISPNKVGAQNPEYLHKADVAMFRRLQKRAGGLIKLVDVAPEEPKNN